MCENPNRNGIEIEEAKEIELKGELRNGGREGYCGTVGCNGNRNGKDQIRTRANERYANGKRSGRFSNLKDDAEDYFVIRQTCPKSQNSKKSFGLCVAHLV